MKSDLDLLNDSVSAQRVFYEQPIGRWLPLTFRFLPTRKRVYEVFFKTKHPLRGSNICVVDSQVDTLYGQLGWVETSGIQCGFVLKFPSGIKTEMLGSCLVCRPTLKSVGDFKVGIQLSLPNLQVLTRGDTSMIAIGRPA